MLGVPPKLANKLTPIAACKPLGRFELAHGGLIAAAPKALDIQGADPMMKPVPERVPKALDAIADVVLAYKPKPKTKPAKKRKKRAAKIAKATTRSLDLR